VSSDKRESNRSILGNNIWTTAQPRGGNQTIQTNSRWMQSKSSDQNGHKFVSGT